MLNSEENTLCDERGWGAAKGSMGVAGEGRAICGLATKVGYGDRGLATWAFYPIRWAIAIEKRCLRALTQPFIQLRKKMDRFLCFEPSKIPVGSPYSSLLSVRETKRWSTRSPLLRRILENEG